MSFESAWGVRVLVVDAVKPFSESAGGVCKANEIRGALANKETSLYIPNDLDSFDDKCFAIYSDGESFAPAEKMFEVSWGGGGQTVSQARPGTYYCVERPFITPEGEKLLLSKTHELVSSGQGLLSAVNGGSAQELTNLVLTLILVLLAIIALLLLFGLIIVVKWDLLLDTLELRKSRIAAKIRWCFYERRWPILYWYAARVTHWAHARTRLDFFQRSSDRLQSKACDNGAFAAELAHEDCVQLAEIMGAILFDDRIVIVGESDSDVAHVLRPKDFERTRLDRTLWLLPPVSALILIFSITFVTGFEFYVEGFPGFVLMGVFFWLLAASCRFELRRVIIATDNGVVITMRVPIQDWETLHSWMNGSLRPEHTSSREARVRNVIMKRK